MSNYIVELRAAANIHREIFVSYQDAGFNDEQALHLTTAVVIELERRRK
ncbi:hypothetical protein [Arthrobacter roseus]|nr:hypothetical protein [Arthrobacter roseus]MBM7847479.1 hypothetical protein [Arthrobacter roseus]